MAPTGNEPRRTCVGCRREAGKRELVRLCKDSAGRVRVDLSGRASGRGAYLHPERTCVEVARRRGALERALRGRPDEEAWAGLELLLAGRPQLGPAPSAADGLK